MRQLWDTRYILHRKLENLRAVSSEDSIPFQYSRRVGREEC
jgi:hypothetical protein